MEKKTLEVGDYLYYTYTPRYGDRSTEIHKQQITAVGRKYYSFGKTKVEKTTLVEYREYGGNKQYYISEQEILDAKAKRDNIDSIRKFFGQWGSVNITLGQTEQILSIINSNQDA